MSFQAQVSGVQNEDFTVDFPSMLPGHPAFLYELTGLGDYYSREEFNSEYLVFICLQVLKTKNNWSGGSVGLSPHPAAWADFLSQHENR